jgi:hypothetical protein
MTSPEIFHEATPLTVPIRDMNLTLSGTWLEPVLREFEQEVIAAGIHRLKPRFYLSNEWGVSDSLAIGIPFYLAKRELIAVHADRVGHVEGSSRTDVLRYLRHELGHVICYAYRLYDEEEYVKIFGANTQPYVEEFRVEPFSRRYVRHLPGWYAQKHPEEDWCETFAVWITPGLDWRSEYAGWPDALVKLEYCDATIRRIGDAEPLATSTHQEDDITQYTGSVTQFYEHLDSHNDELLTLGKIEMPAGLDGALKSIFEELGDREDKTSAAPRKPASTLILNLEQELLSNIYRWTGHFPERTRPLLRHLAQRADNLAQVYPQDRETQAAIALTALVTTLAMNFSHHGKYLP